MLVKPILIASVLSVSILGLTGCVEVGGPYDAYYYDGYYDGYYDTGPVFLGGSHYGNHRFHRPGHHWYPPGVHRVGHSDR